MLSIQVGKKKSVEKSCVVEPSACTVEGNSMERPSCAGELFFFLRLGVGVILINVCRDRVFEEDHIRRICNLMIYVGY